MHEARIAFLSLATPCSRTAVRPAGAFDRDLQEHPTLANDSYTLDDKDVMFLLEEGAL